MSTFISYNEHSGHVYKSDSVYATAHDAATGTADNTGEHYVGQTKWSSSYAIFRSGISWDTSSIPDSAVISSATIYLNVTTVTLYDDFDVCIVSGEDLADTLVAADYGELNARNTVYGLRAASGLSVGTWNAFTVDTSRINASGSSRFGFKSSRDIFESPPSDGEGNIIAFDAAYIEVVYSTPLPPTVTTQDVTDIGYDSATGHGTIVSGDSITQHGVCWNTTGTPTTSDDKTQEGVGSVGAFTSEMTGLSPGVTYYVRAYATNGAGTSYGSTVSFQTNGGWEITLGLLSSVSTEVVQHNFTQAIEGLMGLSVEVSTLRTFNRTLETLIGVTSSVHPSVTILEFTSSIGSRVIRDIVGDGPWVHSEYERGIADDLALASAKYRELSPNASTIVIIGLAPVLDRDLELLREHSAEVNPEPEVLREMGAARVEALGIGTSPKRTKGVGRTIPVQIGEVISRGQKYSASRYPETSVELRMPPETSGDPPSGVIGGVTEYGYSPWYWWVSAHGETDEVYGSTPERTRIFVREASVDAITMQLFMGEKQLELSGVDHVEIEFRDKQRRAYRYSTEDETQRVFILDEDAGRIGFTPPATLFRTRRSPYEMYVWIFENPGVKFSIPEEEEALVEVRGNY